MEFNYSVFLLSAAEEDKYNIPILHLSSILIAFFSVFLSDGGLGGVCPREEIWVGEEGLTVGQGIGYSLELRL